MRVLLVEDDYEQAAVLVSGLSEHGIDVVHEATFDDGVRRGCEEQFDVAVLDVMLPGGLGFELCAEFRAAAVATRVLMLTARDAVEDRVRGLNAGADDYITKPFAFREFLARVRAVGRRPPEFAPDRVTIDDLDVDFRARRVSRAGRTLQLTEKEFALLEIFVRHNGQVLDREAIATHVWGDNFETFTNVIEVLIARLRRKIDNGSRVQLIQTLRGCGYRFAAGA